MKFIIHKTEDGKYVNQTIDCTSYKLANRDGLWSLHTFGEGTQIYLTFLSPRYQALPRDDNTDLMNRVITYQLHQLIDEYSEFHIATEGLLDFIKMAEKLVTLAIEELKKLQPNLPEVEMADILNKSIRLSLDD